MGFDPGIEIGERLTNEEMRKLFCCGNMGGMRRSKKTGTLVIISDQTKGLYYDEWKDGVLHYTGMGKNGDQVLKGNQNETLYYSETNGVEVHLFEVLEERVYTYCGVVQLVDKPYKAKQLDNNKKMREVWVFPLKPIASSGELVEKAIIGLSNQELVDKMKSNSVNKEPQKVETIVYYRDPYLKEMIKRIAGGKCQFCGEDAPFMDKNNKPYLEEHHVKRLADGGEDNIDNVVAICPNCHRKIHILGDKADIMILEQIAAKNRRDLERLLAYEQKRVEYKSGKLH